MTNDNDMTVSRITTMTTTHDIQLGITGYDIALCDMAQHIVTIQSVTKVAQWNHVQMRRGGGGGGGGGGGLEGGGGP